MLNERPQQYNRVRLSVVLRKADASSTIRAHQSLARAHQKIASSTLEDQWSTRNPVRIDSQLLKPGDGLIPNDS